MTEPQDRNNFRAYAALDDRSRAYLVLEPIREGAGLEKSANRLPEHMTLEDASQLAAAFNEGRTWALRVNPEQVLKGAEFPASLHRLPKESP